MHLRSTRGNIFKKKINLLDTLWVQIAKYQVHIGTRYVSDTDMFPFLKCQGFIGCMELNIEP